MSDILEKLIGVEKKATELVAEAEAEAARRKGAARAEAGRLHADRVRDKAQELDRLLESLKREIAGERESENSRYIAELGARRLHLEEFRKVVKPLLDAPR